MGKQKSKTMEARIKCFLVAIAILVPSLSIYAGYMLGETMAPYKNILPDREVVMDSARLNLSYYRTHNLSIQLEGGLGAQMFQYAALYGLSKVSGLLPTITSDSDIAKIVEVFPFLNAHKSEKSLPGFYFLKFREHKTNAFDLRAFSLNFEKNIELIGAFQSWQYFDHVRAEIRQQFSFSQRAIGLVQDFLHESLQKARHVRFETKEQFGDDSARFPVTYVGVHVRRGDYLKPENIKLGFQAADENYLTAAMHFYRHKYKNVIFVVSSDDLDWSKGHISSTNQIVAYTPFSHPGLDLCLLSQCNHTIITTGAFGWWAGWLADGTVLYYKDHPVPKSDLAKEFRATDYYLPSWLPVTT